MSSLALVRAALSTALESVGLNVSGGDDVTPPGAAIGAFEVEYHTTIGGTPTSQRRALVNVRVVTSRAEPASANAALDDALTDMPDVLEKASGPWLQLLVRGGGPGEPLTIGEATYATAVLSCEVYL